jgi:hypothetical protein
MEETVSALFLGKAKAYYHRCLCNKGSTVTVSVKQFLRQRAVNVAVDGQYKIANWFDAEGKPSAFTCQTRRVSPFRMIVAVPVVGRVGDRISSYFGDFGKLNGLISETVADGFLLELAMTRPMREKLANKLTWLEKKQRDSNVYDCRMQARFIPANPQSTLIFADGSTHNCFIIDVSATSVAVSADVQPEIGMALAVGAAVGRVVRIFDDGFAVKFVKTQNLNELERRHGDRAFK